MPARTLNDFFAGFFYHQIKADLKADLKVEMGNIEKKSDRRNGTRRKSSRRKGDTKPIKIEGKGDKEQEVTVRHETASQPKEKSTWSWHEEFAVDWSETFLTKKSYPRKGE